MRIVLIGGQALNYWCERYEESVDLGEWLPTSKDIDFQGTKEDAELVAEKLRGELVVAKIEEAQNHVAIVEVPTGKGSKIKFDFLTGPFGPLKPSKVLEAARAVPLDGPSGRTVIVHVMHPVHCLVCRLHNVMGLPAQYDNAHGLAQLRAAVACTRASIEEQLDAGEVRPALVSAKAVFRVALDDRGLDLFRTKEIDLFEAVPLHPGWPEMFLEREYPKWVSKLEDKRARRVRLFTRKSSASAG